MHKYLSLTAMPNRSKLMKGDLPRAKEYAMRALAADPRNPVALKNLGAIFGKEGDSLKDLYYLRRSHEIDPLDPQTVYGLAFAYMELGDIEQAQKHFQAVLEMEAPEDLRGLARNGLREIAVRGLKSRGREWMRSSTCWMRCGCSAEVDGGYPIYWGGTAGC